jgi:cytochrome c553
MRILSAFLIASALGGVCAANEITPTRSVWDGVFTEEQATHGAALYEAHCGSCHGATLAGHESAPPLNTQHLLGNWDGLTLGDLLDRIRITMPQNAVGTLSGQEYADVLAFVLRFDKFPAGKVKLSRSVDALRDIRFEAARTTPATSK